MKQYCITGLNKLSREREVITVPCSLPNAAAILKREKAKPARYRAYIHLKIQLYPKHKQLNIEFKE